MRFHTLHFLIISVLALLAACTSSKGPLFGKRSPHEKYADGINSAGLKETRLGRAWFLAANKSLTQPQRVVLPFKEIGYFASETPSSAGYGFTAKRGEKIIVSIITVPSSGILFFAELWQASPRDSSLLTVMDTLHHQLQYIVKKDDEQFILRLQPELLLNLEYTVTISIEPSLAFPVDRSGNPKFISFWGVGRDAGARTHEGVDIAAKFRTPALAATDGVIIRVNDNTLGGKVVFLHDDHTGNRLYYAHLDSQIARVGERVHPGDVIGLVGKTGNARNTVPHLHFGIYTGNGAIDPLAFIDTSTGKPKPVTAPIGPLNTWLRTTSVVSLRQELPTRAGDQMKLSSGEAVFILAASENSYKVQLPGGETGYISSGLLTNKRLREYKTTAITKLLGAPHLNAPGKAVIDKGDLLSVAGSYGNFLLVNYNNLQGWIANND